MNVYVMSFGTNFIYLNGTIDIDRMASATKTEKKTLEIGLVSASIAFKGIKSDFSIAENDHFTKTGAKNIHFQRDSNIAVASTMTLLLTSVG